MNFWLRIFYFFCSVFSFFFPRKKGVWVFGNKKGYLDNTRYFFEYVLQQKRERCVWLANNEMELSELISLRHEACLKNSLKGIWISARADVHFICNGFGDVHRVLALRGKVVSFWHGTPIKKIFLDSDYDLFRFGKSFPLRFFAKHLMIFLNRSIFIYYASSEFERKLVARSAGISFCKTVSLGSPRFDNISKIKSRVNFGFSASKIFLYAPTWRERGEWGGGIA